jgi:hypothetical protein
VSGDPLPDGGLLARFPAIREALGDRLGMELNARADLPEKVRRLEAIVIALDDRLKALERRASAKPRRRRSTGAAPDEPPIDTPPLA